MNDIERIQTYLTDMLDEIYKREALSSVLDNAGTQIVRASTSKALIPKMGFSGGLAAYDRDSGAVARSMNMEFEVFDLERDRGAKLTLDAVEDIDSASILLTNMESEFIRTKVAPETDAYRFARYAGLAGHTATGSLTADNIEDELLTAIAALEDAEVPIERLLLFINPLAYRILKEEVLSRRLVEGTAIQNAVATYEGIPVYRVPTARFNTAVTLGSDGFTLEGDTIDFILIDRQAPMQAIRHQSSRLFPPERNQTTDGWMWRFRYFHDAFVPENKRPGIYVHTGGTDGGTGEGEETAEEPEASDEEWVKAFLDSIDSAVVLEDLDTALEEWPGCSVEGMMWITNSHSGAGAQLLFQMDGYECGGGTITGLFNFVLSGEDEGTDGKYAATEWCFYSASVSFSDGRKEIPITGLDVAGRFSSPLVYTYEGANVTGFVDFGSIVFGDALSGSYRIDGVEYIIGDE